MPTLLCETVTAPTLADLVTARDRVTAADMVELRLDGVAGLDVAGALAGRQRPAIVTCRPTWEGGRFAGSEDERRQILTAALDHGAEFVDVEWRAGFDDVIARAPQRVVLSSHDFDGVPRDLASRAAAMRSTGAGVIKIAVATSRLSETLALRPIGLEGNAVVIGMGDAGFPTRALAACYGSRWTYAGNAVAPGQVAPERLVGDYGFRRVARDARLFGVVSTTAMHSLSPVMHNAALAAAGINAVYVPLPTADFADFLEYADAMGIDGVSVTIPFKLDALRAASDVDEITQVVGAANTLRRTPGGWSATNTDVPGFLAPLEDALPDGVEGRRFAVVGAGGAARAVVVGLRQHGAAVTVHARRREQAQTVADQVGAAIGPWPPTPGSWDVLVNCTPLGGANARQESPLPEGPFDGRLVYDLTYGSGPSRLLAEARAAGCATIDGLPMLVAQAERQFQWWMGQRPPVGVMEAALRKRICS